MKNYLQRDALLRKRILDLCVCIPLLAVISPLMLLLLAVVRSQLGSPVIFKQQRPGLCRRPFILYKFRTMTDHTNRDGELLSDQARLTRLGIFLRKTSLDELPELFNVLKGDMSLVGPRPLLMQYLPYYTDREDLRHQVKPGITGWAQINGRNFAPWDTRLDMDAWYVEHWSLLLDIRILLITAVKVIKREDVAPNTDSVETFLNEERETSFKATQVQSHELSQSRD